MALNFLNDGYFAGKVGIGTASPSANLEIESASNPEISIASTAGATSNYLNFKATSHTQPIQSQIKTVDNNDFTADLAFSFKGTGTSGALSERMRIEAGGNVGIATDSPGTFLQLGTYNVGEKYINQATYPDIPSEHMMHITAPSTFSYYGGGISFGETAFTAANIVVRDAGAGGALDLCFGTGTATGVTEKMRIANDGNVGIGIDIPLEKLDVRGDMQMYNSYASGVEIKMSHVDPSSGYDSSIIKSVLDTISPQDTGSSMLRFYTNQNSGTSSAVALDLTKSQNAIFYGNVGIGETLPSSKLDVVGANSGSIPLVELTASGTGTFQRGVRLLNGGMNVGDSIMYAIGYADNSKNMGQTYFYYAGNGSTSNRISIGLHGVNDVLNVLGTGNVGIGETDPVSELHISKSKIGNVALAVQNKNASYSSQVRFLNSVGTEMSAITFVPSDNSLRFYNNGNDKMIISSAGAMQFNAYGAGVLVTDASGNITATTSPPVDGITFNNGATITNQINTDVDTGTETIASVATATHDSAFFDFVIKKGLNVRSGTVYACHDGDTTPLVAFTETSTQDLGDTSDVTLSVVISGTNMELQATTTSDNWSIKSLIRAI